MAQQVYYATGRRKTSAARVYLTQGNGQITVNGRKLAEYFGLRSTQKVAMQAIEASSLGGKVNMQIMVAGDGFNGQAGAIRHGIARAPNLMDATLRGALKKEGYLTRDSRMVERKKYGRSGARKRYQFSKR